jgi:hypothetical protein
MAPVFGCYTECMSDIAGHSAPQHATDGLRHTLSLKEVETQLQAAGVPRSHRHVVRLCKSGAFDASKRPGASGDEWFIAPQSVPKVIGDLRAIEEARARHSQSQPAASDHVAPGKARDENPDTARHGALQPAASEPQDKEGSATEHATSRYVSLLERENEFLRGQVGKKDEQISDLSKRFSETQILLGAMQKMLAPLLGQGDPFRTPPQNREVADQAAA